MYIGIQSAGSTAMTMIL